MDYLERKDLRVGLQNDQDEIRRQLWILRMLMSRGDYDFVEKRVLELLPFLDSIFAKDETILSFCENESVVVFHKEQFIESLIQKRKAVSDSFREIRYLTRFSSDVERFSCFDRFEKTLLNYLSLENSAVMSVSFETNKEDRGTIAPEKKKSQGSVLLNVNQG